MKKSNFSYLVLEDEIHANKSIINRMNVFENWSCAGAVYSLKEGLQIIESKKPHLLFLDWEVRGGNTFTLLEHISLIKDYNPYIIYFTGYQNDVPEIPMNIINKYRVNKYLVKPIFQNLTSNLNDYVREAEEIHQKTESKAFWIENSVRSKVKLIPENIIFISQCKNNSRIKLLNMVDGVTLEIKSNWNKCIKIAEDFNIDFSFPNARNYMINNRYITKLQRPYIWLNNNYKIEVTRDKWKEYF